MATKAHKHPYVQSATLEPRSMVDGCHRNSYRSQRAKPASAPGRVPWSRVTASTMRLRTGASRFRQGGPVTSERES